MTRRTDAPLHPGRRQAFLPPQGAEAPTAHPRRLLPARRFASTLAMALTGFPVSGTAAFANLNAGLWSMKQTHQVSEHDRKIATKLAFVFTGGNGPANSRVSEQSLRDLERTAFMSLIGEEKSQARMQSLLTTGKPLRN